MQHHSIKDVGNGLTLYHAPAWGCHEHKFIIFTTELTTTPGATLATPGDYVVQFDVECVFLCGRQTGICIYRYEMWIGAQV